MQSTNSEPNLASACSFLEILSGAFHEGSMCNGFRSEFVKVLLWPLEAHGMDALNIHSSSFINV